MRVSLPEQRLLLGKVGGLGEEPISLTPLDAEVLDDRARAQKVLMNGSFFNDQQRDRILAKLFLGA